MNLVSPIAPHQITVTLMLETQPSGGFVASVMEFPDCRVEAASREAAISLVHAEWESRIEQVEFLPLSLPLPSSPSVDNPWTKLFGLYKDDTDFAEIAAAMRAEREVDDDSEVDPSVYQC